MKKIWMKLVAMAMAIILCGELLPLNAFAQMGENAEGVNEEVSVEENVAAAPDAGILADGNNASDPLEVLYEVEELRDASEKHFRMSDGSYIAVQYDYPVHYEDDDGVWQEIDNTLALSGSNGDAALMSIDGNGERTYQAVNGDNAVQFPVQLSDGTLYEVDDGDYSIRLVAGAALYVDEVEEQPIDEGLRDNSSETTTEENGEDNLDDSAATPTEPPVQEDESSSEESATSEETQENEDLSIEESEDVTAETDEEETDADADSTEESTDEATGEETLEYVSEDIPAVALDGTAGDDAGTDERLSETVSDAENDTAEPDASENTLEEDSGENEESSEVEADTSEPEEGEADPGVAAPEITPVPEAEVTPAPEVVMPSEAEEETVVDSATAMDIAQTVTASDGAVERVFNEAEAVVLSDVAVMSAISENDSEEDLYTQIRQEKAYSSIVYEDVYEDVTLQYDLFGPNIKESIIIGEPKESYEYIFSLYLEGLTPELDAESGAIYLKDGDDIAYMMPAPYMFDDNGETSTAVAYGLATVSGGHYVLVVSASKEWINSEDRAFPVTIDPTLYDQTYTATGGRTGITVNYLTSGKHSYTATDHRDQVCGRSSVSTIDWCTMFLNVNDLPTLPKNCVVTDAQIALYCKELQTVGNAKLTVEAKDVISDKPTSPAHDTCGTWIGYMDYDEMEATVTLDSNTLDYHIMTTDDLYRYSSWNVTRAALRWYENASNSQKPRAIGLIPSLSDDTYVVATFYGYHTSSGAMFIVSYRNTVGVESYHTYQTVGIDRAGTAYVGDFTGQLTLAHSDVSLEKTTFSFDLSHVYNSANSVSQFTNSSSAAIHTKTFSSMKMGLGWKLSAQETVVPISLSGINYLVYNDADGTEHYFMQDGSSSTYNDEDGLGLKIIKSTSGSDTIYTMTDTDAYNTKVFHNGYLISSTDSNGNAMYYAYNNEYSTSGTSWKPDDSSSNQLVQIVQQTDLSTASQITLATLAYNSDGTLNTITDYASRTTTFSYDSSGRLTQITHPDGTTAIYSYDSNGYMTQAKDSESTYGINISYSSNATGGYTVSSVQEFSSAGNGAAFSATHYAPQKMSYRYYGADRTANTDDDLVVFNMFDYWGRTVNSYTMDNTESELYGASSAVYTTNSGTDDKNNHITSTATAGIYSQNLLKDSGLEHNDEIGAWAVYGEGGSVTETVFGVLPQLGNKMIMIGGCDDGISGMKQSVSLSAGTTYTFSAYFDTISLRSGDLYVAFLDGSGNVLKKSEVINYSLYTDSGWERSSVTYTPASSGSYYVAVFVSNGLGYAFCDNLQLEVGEVASAANLLQSGSFEDVNYSSSYWYNSSSSAVSRVSGVGRDGSYSIRINGSATNDHWHSQYVNINKTGEDVTFVVSGWGKAYSTTYPEYKDEGRRFGLGVKFHYEDGSTSYQFLDFSYAITDWQYVSEAVLPDSTTKVISRIEVYPSYYDNLNTAYFDDISLVMLPTQSYSYDSGGNLVAATDSQGKTAYEYYSDTSLLKSYTDLAGVEYSMTYASTTNNLLTTTSDGVTTTNYYNSAGSTTGSKTKAGTDDCFLYSWSSYLDDGSAQWTETVDGVGYRAAYNSRLLVQSGALKYGGLWTYTSYYIYSGRPYMSYISGNIALTYGYSDGQISSLSRKTFWGEDTLWQQYSMPHDSFGNTLSISVKQSEDSGTTWSNGRTLVGYTYEGNNGRLSELQYGNGANIDYTYDIFDRVVEAEYNDGTEYHYAYNANGDLARQYVTDSAGTETSSYGFVYDALGRLIRSRETGEDGSLIQWTEHIYDTANRLTRQTWRLGSDYPYTEIYSYDEDDGKLTKIERPYIGEQALNYDALKRLETEVTTVSGSTTPLYTKTYSYRDSTATEGRTTLQVSKVDYTLNSGYSLDGGSAYSYNLLGNISQISDALTGYARVTYTYDDLERLTEERYPEPSTNDWEEINYVYDTAGNIRSVTAETYLDSEVASSTTHTYSYDDANWVDLLTAYDGVSLTYDAIGNPLSYYNGTSYTMTWAKGRQLAGVSVGDETTGTTAIAYAYDMDGIRSSKTVGGVTTEFVTQNGLVVRQGWGGSSIAFFYDAQQRPYAMRYTPSGGTAVTYYYLTDLQGDVIALLDSSGSVVARYEYGAWGDIRSITDGSGAAVTSSTHIANINPLRYRGYYYDAETGFYYLQSRYYDPIIKRFINADAAEYSALSALSLYDTNLFAYCRNNPVNLSDVSGDLPSWAVKVIVATAVVAVAAGVAAITVATAGTGTAAAIIAIGAAKGAAIGMASGTAIGAVSGGISHRVSTGSWSGAGDSILNGIGNGALSGAITGAVTGAVGSVVKVSQAARMWDSSSKGGPWANMSHHYKKHILLEGKPDATRNVITYTKDAVSLWNETGGVGRIMPSGSVRLKGSGMGGFYSPNGLIRSFFY